MDITGVICLDSEGRRAGKGLLSDGRGIICSSTQELSSSRDLVHFLYIYPLPLLSSCKPTTHAIFYFPSFASQPASSFQVLLSLLHIDSPRHDPNRFEARFGSCYAFRCGDLGLCGVTISYCHSSYGVRGGRSDVPIWQVLFSELVSLRQGGLTSWELYRASARFRDINGKGHGEERTWLFR